jgi:HAD superfamily hydrolase (TIGR01509 family)
MYDLTLVLFDMDGVLVKTMPLLRQTYLDVARHLGVRQPSKRELDKVMQIGPGRALKELFRVDTNEVESNFNRHWRTNIGKVACFAGVTAMLESLSSSGITSGIVTSRNSLDTYSLLDAARIRAYMEIIVTWGHYRIAKPSPACLLAALKRTDKPPNRVAYVGDQVVDVMAARGARVLAVGAIWDTNASEHDLIAAGADVIVKEPREITALALKT